MMIRDYDDNFLNTRRYDRWYDHHSWTNRSRHLHPLKCGYYTIYNPVFRETKTGDIFCLDRIDSIYKEVAIARAEKEIEDSWVPNWCEFIELDEKEVFIRCWGIDNMYLLG